MKKIWYFAVIFGIIGALATGLLAQSRKTTVTQTYKGLFASMVNPSESLSSPRTYNQTLVETIDQADFIKSLNEAGVAEASSVQFDILPDSFHIQTTVGLAQAINSDDELKISTETANYLLKKSDELANNLFTDGTQQVAVTHTRVLPTVTILEQNPISAGWYGLIAGALFGWFIGLAFKDNKKN